MEDKIRQLEAQGHAAEAEGRYMEAANSWRLALELADEPALRAHHERILKRLRAQFAAAVRRSAGPSEPPLREAG